MGKKIWYETTPAAAELGVSTKKLYRMRKDKTIKKGPHWKVKDPTKKRLDYLYNVPAIDALQKSVVTEVEIQTTAAPVGIQPALVDGVEPYGITAAGEAVPAS